MTSTELTCEMAGYVPPNTSFRWYRNNRLLENNTKYTTIYRSGTRHAQQGGMNITDSVVTVLIITSLQANDSGMYECRVEDYQHATGRVSLTVKQTSK